MAPKRKSIGGSTTPAQRQSSRNNLAKAQATLAFHGQANKVSKSNKVQLGKDTKATKVEAVSISPATANIKTESEPTTVEKVVAEQAHIEEVAPLTVEEKEARSVTGTQIKKYWSAKESARKAPRVHQEDLSLHEKVCRQWDTDGRYGPCMGIARIKRWKRASKLGLQPPIEVLAVLLQEQSGGNVQAQRAYVDELMGSRGIET